MSSYLPSQVLVSSSSPSSSSPPSSSSYNDLNSSFVDKNKTVLSNNNNNNTTTPNKFVLENRFSKSGLNSTEGGVTTATTTSAITNDDFITPNSKNVLINKFDLSLDSKLDESSNNKLHNLSNKKIRSMYPHQQKNYGPKATLKTVTDEYLLVVQDPLSQNLSWTKPPLYVLVIKKICNTMFEPFTEIIKFLIYDHSLIVYVEEDDYENEIFRLDEQIQQAMKPSELNYKPSLRKFCQSSPNYTCKNPESADVNKIDLVICLGGDGTLLHASTLFQKSCPPVLSIHMGSLGFLCPFGFDDYREYVNGVIKGGVPLLLRNRLRCKLEKSDTSIHEIKNQISSPIRQSPNDTSSSISNSSSNGTNLDMNESLELIALNEIVISRGPSPYLSNLDLYLNDYLITTVQGDGLIISTPTGSTAYAMAAGASMCHPSVQSIIIAPICPHSLSFRPIVVPAGVELKIALNDDARHPSAWYSVDGRNTTELKQGFYLSICTSEYPLPSICRSDQINDWFEGLATCLHWNQRQKQLPINACYLQSRTQSIANLQSQSQFQSSLSSKSSSTSSLKFNLNTNLNLCANKLTNAKDPLTDANGSHVNNASESTRLDINHNNNNSNNNNNVLNSNGKLFILDLDGNQMS